MTNNYMKVKTGRGWVFLFFDDNDPQAVAKALERATELGFSRVAVYRTTINVRAALHHTGYTDGVLEVGQVPDVILEEFN